MNTRRFPRTLQEAFGPHTSRRIDEPRPRTPRHEKVLYAVALIAVLVVVGLSGCSGDTVEKVIDELTVYGPDQHGVVCYRKRMYEGISCVKVRP